jgi:FkbM family methyltransferase
MVKIKNFQIDLVTILYKIYINKNKNNSNSQFFKKTKKKIEKKIIKQNFNSILIKFSNSWRGAGIKLRYFKMGKLNPSYLLGYNELIIFSFYLFNKKKYQNFIDVGANIGLHSIFFDKFNVNVKSFEPDEYHFKELKRNLLLNKTKNVKPYKFAVSNKNGNKTFVRVCDNTTGSHLIGKKKNLYGKLEKFKVKTVNLNKFLNGNCLVKIDAEGSEVDILKSIKKENFLNNDYILEINNKKNAIKIFNLSKKNKTNIFSQKIGWKKVEFINNLPMHHTEGSIIITYQKCLEW